MNNPPLAEKIIDHGSSVYSIVINGEPHSTTEDEQGNSMSMKKIVSKIESRVPFNEKVTVTTMEKETIDFVVDEKTRLGK